MTSDRDDTEKNVIALHAEEISVSKRKVTTARVRVSVVTRQHEELVNELLAREQVEIERTAIGNHRPAIIKAATFIARAPASRTSA